MTITTDIRELSFVSLKPIPAIPYFWNSVQPINNIDTQDINKSIGKIANQLKWQNRLAIATKLRIEYNMEIGLGLGELAGKVWRIGLMGYNSKTEKVLLLLAALKKVLKP